MYDMDERKPNSKKEMKIFSKIFTEREICDANYRARPVQLAGQNFNMRV